jgi:TonB family protein
MPTPGCVSGSPCHRSHGHVRLVIDVLEDGKVGEIRVETGNARFADAAIEAAQQAQFIPGSYLGVPQNMDYVLNIRF